jgi:putative transposase
MRQSRYTEEQIVGILKESEAGLSTLELCRKHGISEQTFYRWKAKYGGFGVSDAQRLRHLEEENRKLKQLVAEQALDIVGFKAVLSKDGWSDVDLQEKDRT